MGKCKDCKHWDTWTESVYGACNVIGLSYEEPAENGAIINDDNVVGQTRFYTGPEFGCVLFEPREAK